MKINFDLVTGEVVVGLRPVLPIEVIYLILGNKLAGDWVWPNVPPSPMVLSGVEFVQDIEAVKTIEPCLRVLSMS